MQVVQGGTGLGDCTEKEPLKDVKKVYRTAEGGQAQKFDIRGIVVSPKRRIT